MSSALKTQIQTVSNYSGTLMTFYEAPLCDQSYLSMFLITPDERAQKSREGRNRNLCSFKQETGKAAYTVRKCDGQGGGAHVVLCWSRDLPTARESRHQTGGFRLRFSHQAGLRRRLHQFRVHKKVLSWSKDMSGFPYPRDRFCSHEKFYDFLLNQKKISRLGHFTLKSEVINIPVQHIAIYYITG